MRREEVKQSPDGRERVWWRSGERFVNSLSPKIPFGRGYVTEHRVSFHSRDKHECKLLLREHNLCIM